MPLFKYDSPTSYASISSFIKTKGITLIWSPVPDPESRALHGLDLDPPLAERQMTMALTAAIAWAAGSAQEAAGVIVGIAHSATTK